MASPHGISGQWGYVSETNPGQAITVNKFLPFVSENVGRNIARLESQGKRAGRMVVHSWKSGGDLISGSVELELWNTDIATLLYHCFGGVATATNGAQWDYTYTPGDLTGQSFTMQVGRPDIGGTVRPFTWAGCKVGGWQLTANVDQIAMLSLDVLAMTETNGTALASASYDAALAPFVFTEGSLVVASTTNNAVQSFELSGDNAVIPRVRLGSATSREPLANDMRTYDGTIVTDFEDLTAYNRFVNGTESALVLNFDNGTETLVVTTNVRYDGTSPNVSGFGLLTQSLPFKAVSATSDAAAVTVVLTNAEGLTGAA